MIKVRVVIFLLVLFLFAQPVQAQSLAGIKFGATKQEIGKQYSLAPNPESDFRNTFAILDKYDPTEIGLRGVRVGRIVYFDENDRVWRVRLEISDSDESMLDPFETFGVYETLRDALQERYSLVEVDEFNPRVGRGQNPGCEFGLAPSDDAAADMEREERLLYDFACNDKDYKREYSGGNYSVLIELDPKQSNAYYGVILMVGVLRKPGVSTLSDMQDLMMKKPDL